MEKLVNNFIFLLYCKMFKFKIVGNYVGFDVLKLLKLLKL